jgi:hypothetical protein
MAIIDRPSFETWYDFHSKLEPEFEALENENMEDILDFFADPTDTPLLHYSFLLRDEQGIILAVDKSLTSLILIHNMEVLPATRQSKKPVVRALHGFGREAIPVLLDPDVLSKVTNVSCPSVTSIRKAFCEGVTDMTKLPASAIYSELSLIMLPPFVAKALLDLPSLAVDKALAAILDAIATYEKENKPASLPPAAASKPTPEPKSVIVETVDGIESDSEDEESVTLEETPANKKTTPPPASTKKKASVPSTYSRCAQLIKFLAIAQHQQYHFDSLDDEIINGSLVRPTLELQHRQWAAIRQVQAEVNEPNKASNGAPNNATTDPKYLVERVANPLNDIQASLNSIMQKYNDTNDQPTTESAKSPMKKLEDKLDKVLIDQFKRLSSTDGTSPRDDLEPFLIKFMTAKGTGGTGAMQILVLNNKRNRRNINIPIGCVTAMHQGRFGWDHPTFPNNFSAFYTPRANVMDMGKAANAELLNVHLRAEVGKGVENGDISKITKQFMTVPGTVPDLVKQLGNHNKLQGDFWGTESMIYKECERFIRGIEEYEASYESAHVADPMFLSKVMYYYDLTLYHLYDECLVQENFMAIRWELADLQKCHTKVLQGQFFQSLPQVLQAPTSKKREIDRISGEPLRSITAPKGKEKGPSLPNPDQQSIMKLQPSESFNDVVLRTQQMKLVPVWPGSKRSVCLNWHINGRCHEKCDRKESHKMLTDGTLKQMGAFLKACRAAHKKVTDARE